MTSHLSNIFTAIPFRRDFRWSRRRARVLHLTAFTGAGISVESGIPLFRGEGGMWNTSDPQMLEIRYFLERPEVAWPNLREIFFEHFSKAKPNKAHEVLAAWETRGYSRAQDFGERGYLCALIKQNPAKFFNDPKMFCIVAYGVPSTPLYFNCK